MQIDFHRKYLKQWSKLSRSEQIRIAKAVQLFAVDSTSPKLRLHQLKGKYYPHYSISVGGDLRAHFTYKSPKVVVFMAVGTHSQLYE